jgi:hypothetical protein
MPPADNATHHFFSGTAIQLGDGKTGDDAGLRIFFTDSLEMEGRGWRTGRCFQTNKPLKLKKNIKIALTNFKS